MGSYFSVFPPTDIPNGVCSSNFAYKAENTRTYQVSFCLPRALGAYGEGWNAINSPEDIK